jgi:hypothetical protein
MDFDSMPQSETYRRLPLGESRIEMKDGVAWLIVTGEAPCANMEVTLQPFLYIQKPDYWSIELVGHVPGGVCLTSTKSYTAARPLRGVTGHHGIDLIGADGTRRHDIPQKGEAA